jgi:acetylornithine deacetylase/succinyl-diaminopimelate desuccinylase-like protein
MSAGFRTNVIPATAEATINVRMIPGTDPADIAREIARVIGDTRIDVRLAAEPPRHAGTSTLDTDLYRALEKQAHLRYPEAEVTPYLFQAGTDARPWRVRGVPVYGIYPYAIDAEDLTRMHGNDERVSVESLRQGTELIYRTLVDVAGRP